MRTQRSTTNPVWLVAIVVVAFVVILSPAYLHFTRSGPELGSMPDTPDNPHSDVLCDKIFATYQTQIGDMQAAKDRLSAQAAKSAESQNQSERADISRISDQISDMTSQAIQVRDDCYVKVANWETEQTTAKARQPGTSAPPASFAGRPEAPQGPVMVAQAVEPASSAAAAAPPLRAYAAYSPTAGGARDASADASHEASPPARHVVHHARRRVHAPAAPAATDQASDIQVAANDAAGPRVVVGGSVDKVLVASADGVVVAIPASAASAPAAIEVASSEPANRSVVLASTTSPRRHHAALHRISHTGVRTHAARRLIADQTPPTHASPAAPASAAPAAESVAARPAAEAPVVAAPATPAADVTAVPTVAPPVTAAPVQATSPTGRDPAPATAAQTWSGTDPPTAEGGTVRIGTTCVVASTDAKCPLPHRPSDH
jgi:hypothetical protein